MTELQHSDHPIWSLIRLTILMIALTTILYFTANKFDETEIRTIITMFLITAGMEGLGHLATKVRLQ